MLQSFRSRKSSVLLWILMGMLIVGLAGFGIGVGGGIGTREVASVGDEGIDADVYARALDQQLRGIAQQTGRSLPIEEARQFGIDRQVLSQLLNEAALDGEAADLGLSTGDDRVRDLVLAMPAFRGADGAFDRDTYVAALERAGYTPETFEAVLRADTTRGLITTGLQSATRAGDAAGRRLLAYAGEARRFEWLRLDASRLPAPVAAPTDAELQAEHAAHPDRYTRPDTREITYASVTPAGLAAAIEIPDDELRAAYDADPAQFSTPERRIVDRVGFGTAEDAAAAKARIDAGETDFDAVATERGLTAQQIDQGEVTAAALAPSVRDAVFGLAGPGITGPVDSPLGPALYRVNAVLAASTTSFEDARAELARTRALEAAIRQIHDETTAIEDLIAGGATLEEIASETPMELGSIALNSETVGGLADDPAFRDLAENAMEGEITDLAELADGGLVALRIDAVQPAAVIPLAEVRDRVAADWTAARTAEQLTALAEGYAVEVAGGLSMTDLAARIGADLQAAGPVVRGAALPEVPPALVGDIFAAAAGGTVVQPDGAGAILARLTAIDAFDPGAAANAPILAQVQDRLQQATREDLVALYTTAVRDRAGIEINQALIDSTLARFP